MTQSRVANSDSCEKKEVGRKILFVDDELDIASVFKLALERAGFVVDAYTDPTVALSTVESGKYAVAIFDIRMPKMNGFELYRQFRKLDGKTAVCFLTAFEIRGSEFEKLFPKIEVKAWFVKPINPTALITRLRELLAVDEARIIVGEDEPPRY
jgi:two-component system, OmpR family, response regulator ChvI